MLLFFYTSAFEIFQKHEDAIAAIKGLQYDDGCNFEDLMINFTMPGYPDMELVEGGKDQFLDQFNIEKYIEVVYE